jgi:hypothetical protein
MIQESEDRWTFDGIDEVVVSTPEDSGIPPPILYRPRAEIKLRCAGLDMAEAYLRMLYPGRMSLTEQLLSKEWAMIGAIGDEEASAEIPDYHKAVLDEPLAVRVVACNQRIADAGRRTQNYDKGIERFVRKFDPNQDMESTIEIVKGIHQYHGLAVYTTQKSRRCLLPGTIYGRTDEEALWSTWIWWASLQPRGKQPDQKPGQLFHPAEDSQVFEKYWDYLEDLEEHPEFSQELSFTHGCMKHFSSALSRLDLADFAPGISAEAKQSDLEAAEAAAVSRLHPIQDGPDIWEMHRRSAVTESSVSAPS